MGKSGQVGTRPDRDFFTTGQVMRMRDVTEEDLEQCDAALKQHVELYKSGTRDRKQVEAQMGNCQLCYCLETTRRNIRKFQDGFGAWEMPKMPVLKCEKCIYSDQEEKNKKMLDLSLFSDAFLGKRKAPETGFMFK